MSLPTLTIPNNSKGRIIDPLKFAELLWPHVKFYNKQKDIIYSVKDNDETFVVAGNELGKDFVAGFIILWYFLSRTPCRIVTTSAKEDHLRVLWGEINRFIDTAKYPLKHRDGGPLIVNVGELKKVVKGQRCSISYVKGMVASQDSIDAFGGHHVANTGDGIPRTLFVSDESSSVPDNYYQRASPWITRALVFGNAWPCDNFFKKGVKGGDVKSDTNDNYYRKVIQIKATHSPNVRLAMAQISAGTNPTGEVIIPGVKSYEKYAKHRKIWDKIQQCVGLDAEFYEGSEIMLYPNDWLVRAHNIADKLRRDMPHRKARAIGIDVGEGVANTTWSAIDEYGLIEQESYPTSDTSVITGNTIAFARKHGLIDFPEYWVFDRGGGGKEHADRLRSQGYRVRTVAFGESILLDVRVGRHQLTVKKEQREDKYTYKNRRAEMFGELSLLLDPSANTDGFGIPREYQELRRQMGPIPKLFDPEGRMYMMPKNPKNADDEQMTLVKLLGASPDELDSLAIAVHGMLHKPVTSRAGVAI